MTAAAMPELVRATLSRLGTVRLPVTGTSMLPTLRPGTTVTVLAADFASVRPSTVIAFRSGSKVLVHRVLHRGADRLFTAGDNLPLYDPPVTEEDFLGVIPDAGSAPPRRADMPPGVAGPRVLWLAGPVSVTVPGWQTPPRPADTGELLAATAGAPVIGVSEYGVLSARDVLADALPTGAQVLLGYRFGDRPGQLPPAAAALHLRLAAPGRTLGTDDAARRFLALAGAPR